MIAFHPISMPFSNIDELSCKVYVMLSVFTIATHILKYLDSYWSIILPYYMN